MFLCMCVRHPSGSRSAVSTCRHTAALYRNMRAAYEKMQIRPPLFYNKQKFESFKTKGGLRLFHKRPEQTANIKVSSHARSMRIIQCIVVVFTRNHKKMWRFDGVFRGNWTRQAKMRRCFGLVKSMNTYCGKINK